MIFKIVDGREYFYQWDTNRQIAVDDPTITEVHFCNRVDSCSLVVEVVDGVANVPNVILQYGFKMKVFGYDGEATMHEQEFEVRARTKPSDYVYTETEIKRYEDLNKRIDEMEQAGITQEAIDAAVGKYLKDNPVQDITKVSELENDAGYVTETELTAKDYATKDYVDDAVSNINIPVGPGGTVDLSNYYTKSEVDKKIPDTSKFITEVPSEYVTDSELASYATKTYVDEAIANIDIPEGGGGSGGSGTTLYHHYINISYICTDSNNYNSNNLVNVLITDDSVTPFTIDTFRSYLETGGYTSTSNYLPVVGGIVTNRYTMYKHDSGDMTEDYPAGVVGVYVSGKTIIAFSYDGNASGNYLTHTVYSSSENTNTKVSLFEDKVIEVGIADGGNSGGSGENVDLSDYYTKAEVNALIPKPTDLSNYYTKTEVDSKIPDTSNFVTMAQVEAKGYITSVPSEYVTETELNGKGYLTQHQSLAGYATESYVGTAIQNALNAIGVAEGGAY